MNHSGILKNKLFLYLTEFFAGMSVMAVELGASRLLAPYFSSSQIVRTIVIGTIMIAMALACKPKLLIADEPTTALDVTIQAQIVELMKEMQEKNGNAIIMITHDLGVVADMADKIMVMYAGRPVEFGTAEEIFYESRHPYTWGLIRSIPEQAIDEKKPLTPIHGNPPSLMNLPEGCVFSPRCPYATDKCRKQRPERVVTESGHYSACHYSGDPEFLKNAPETSRTRKDSKKGGEA